MKLTLDQILADVDMMARVFEMLPATAIPATIADTLLQVGIATIKAHEAATGQRLDLNLLRPIDPA